MFTDGFDYRTVARLHKERIDEAESIRRASKAKAVAADAEETRTGHKRVLFTKLKKQIGKKLIAIGERLSTA